MYKLYTITCAFLGSHIHHLQKPYIYIYYDMIMIYASYDFPTCNASNKSHQFQGKSQLCQLLAAAGPSLLHRSVAGRQQSLTGLKSPPIKAYCKPPVRCGIGPNKWQRNLNQSENMAAWSFLLHLWQGTRSGYKMLYVKNILKAKGKPIPAFSGIHMKTLPEKNMRNANNRFLTCQNKRRKLRQHAQKFSSGPGEEDTGSSHHGWNGTGLGVAVEIPENRLPSTVKWCKMKRWDWCIG